MAANVRHHPYGVSVLEQNRRFWHCVRDRHRLCGVTWRLSRSFGLVLRGRLHYLLYNVDENRSLGFWELATAVSYDF